MRIFVQVLLASLLFLAASPLVSAQDGASLPPIKSEPKLVALGKRLFFDPRLSGDSALSCASCHVPEKGFADGKPLSDAYPSLLGFRNTPTLINTAHKKVWFHDGRLGTNLNDVTRDQLTETFWMNMDMRLMQERLKQDPVYVRMFKEAGLGEPSNGGVRKAIPEYLKTLTSIDAPFDAGLMSAAAERGQKLFESKAGCAACHSGALFSDGQAHNLGVPENTAIFEDAARHITFVAFANFMGIQNYMNLRRDPGAYVRTNSPKDMGKFLTPTLRELKYTSPYMHNGTFRTLAEVVQFYNRGGGSDPNKDPRLKPLRLSNREKTDLVAFLNALSGEPLTSAKFVLKEQIDVSYRPIGNWWKARN